MVAFSVPDLNQVAESVKTGLWVGDCFIFTTSGAYSLVSFLFHTGNRLNYYVGGEVVTLAHLDKFVFHLSHLSISYVLFSVGMPCPTLCAAL